MSVEHAPETGTTASGSAAKVTGASIENLSQREASERHVPVMLDRCINLLAPGIERAVEERGTAYVIDGTLGMGGHSEALLERFENLVLIGIDRDLQAHAIAGERLARFGDRFVPVHAVYDEIDRAMETAGVQGIDGILMDLGVSSMQLDERTRGFAYSYDAPLDMRMNSEDELTARIVVNEYSEDQLRRIIRNWGEEKFASRIARAICTARANTPLETTGELVRIIQKAVPRRRAAHRRSPRQAHLPGVAYRSEPRTGSPRTRRTGSPGGAQPRWSIRRHELPQPRRQNRQESTDRGGNLQGTQGLPGRA